MNVWHVFRKELLGALRDRRTLLVVLVFPLVLYPAMFGIQGHFESRAAQKRAALVPEVLGVGLAEAPELEAFLEEQSFLLIPYASLEEALQALQDGLGHVVLVVPPRFEARLAERAAPPLTLHYDPEDEDARAARVKVQLALNAYRDGWVARRLGEAGLSPEVLRPFEVREAQVAGRSPTSMVIVSILPFLIVVMITGGAMAVGAEITAGEKERGTIATLLVSQLSRSEIVLGKFFTILVVSLASSAVSLIGLSFGLGFLASSLGETQRGAVGLHLSPAMLGWMFVVLVPLAAMLSAVILMVGTFARNEKEANVYTAPLYFVIIILGLITTTSGLAMETLKFLLPVINSLTVLQEVLRDALDWGHLALTLISSGGVAGALIALSVAMFNRESILFRT